MKVKKLIVRSLAVIGAIALLIIIGYISLALYINKAGYSEKEALDYQLHKSATIDSNSCEGTARIFLEGLANKDYKSVNKVCSYFSKRDVEESYGGLQIVSIGKPSKSIIFFFYPGKFVPYKIRFKDGSIKRWRLAIRNDFPDGKWRIDGGF